MPQQVIILPIQNPPVIPPEVNGVLGSLWGSQTSSKIVFGCLGFVNDSTVFMIQCDEHFFQLGVSSTIYIPGTCLSSILEVEPSKTRPFSSKTRVIEVPGRYKVLVK